MMQRTKLFLLTLVHFFTDFYSSFLTPLLPIIIVKLNLSLTLAGVLASTSSLTSSLVQPMMGLLADRMKKRYFILIGPLFTAVFMSSIGLAPTFAILVALIVCGGFGTASFHPQTVSMAGDVSGSRRGLGVSLFIGGGTMGLAVSPLFVTSFVDRFGLERLYLVAIPGVLTVLLLSRVVSIQNLSQRTVSLSALRDSFRPHLRTMVLITVVVIVRTLAGMGFATFLPVLMRERGLSLVAGGVVLSLYNVAGVIGGLTGGYLSDRVGRKLVIWSSILAATPFLYGSLHTTGSLMYLMLFFGGLAILASNSVTVAMAQELVPDNASTASSFPMGFSWGVAGVALIAVGHTADRIGVAPTLELLAFVPIAGALLALLLPGQAQRLEAEPATVRRPMSTPVLPQTVEKG